MKSLQLVSSLSSPQIRSTKSIIFQPEQIHFQQVEANKVFLTQLKLTNTLDAPVQLNFRPSSSEKLDVQPKLKKLSAKQTSFVDVKLLMHRLPPFKRIGPTLIKETISIKSNFFDQKVNVIIHLSQASVAKKERSKSRGLSNEPLFKSGVSSSLHIKTTSNNMPLTAVTFGKQNVQHVSQSLDCFSQSLQFDKENKERSRITEVDELAQSNSNMMTLIPDSYMQPSDSKPVMTNTNLRIEDLQQRNKALNLQLEERQRQILQMSKQRQQEIQSAREKELEKIEQLNYDLEKERELNTQL